MPVPLQVLILDSQPGCAESIVDELRRAGFEPRCQRVDSEADYLSQLKSQADSQANGQAKSQPDEKLDVIIADCGLPQLDGSRALRHLKAHGLDIPFIAVAGSIGEEAAVQYIKQGAADFLHRDHIARLGEVVKAALQAKQSQDEKRTASELSADYIYILRVEPSGAAALEWVNNSFTSLTGFTAEEFQTSDGWTRLIHPDDHKLVQARLKTLLAGQPETSEYRIVTKGGAVRWIQDRSRPEIVEGRVVRIYGAAQDITRYKRALDDFQRINAELEEYLYERTAELHRQQTLLQTILDSMGEGVLYSKESRIGYVNRALAELTGYRTEELVDQPNIILQSATMPEEAARLLTEKAPGPGLTRRGEVRLRRKDGTEFDAALTVTLMAQPKGEIIGAVTIVRDITTEKQLQEQKTRFIANASHELRTPLTNIKTRMYLMRKQPERMNEHALALERAADRMAELVEDLLDITRFERGVIQLYREEVDLQKLVVDVAEAQQEEAARKRINLAMEAPTEVVRASIDQKRMTQVITNLVTNAINYTPEGGNVSVKLLKDDEHEALIRVEDTGIGISPENLSRVFEPFFRVNENAGRGTGLGLSISREIVSLHGGELAVESQLGAGSAFIVKLPRD